MRKAGREATRDRVVPRQATARRSLRRPASPVPARAAVGPPHGGRAACGRHPTTTRAGWWPPPPITHPPHLYRTPGGSGRVRDTAGRAAGTTCTTHRRGAADPPPPGTGSRCRTGMGSPPPPRAPKSPWRSIAVGGGWQGRVCKEPPPRLGSDRLGLECPALRRRYPCLEARDGAAPLPADQHALSGPDERWRCAAAVTGTRQYRRGGEESRGRRSRRRRAPTPRRAARRQPPPARPPWAVRVIASPPPAPLAQRRTHERRRGRRVPARGAPQRFGGVACHRHVCTKRAHGLISARGEATVVGPSRLRHRAQGEGLPPTA